jgi:CheY-like chemotaxis protein
VLAIDDDPIAQDLMRRALAKEGYRVESAAGGDEGIRRARELMPDVITLDIIMPRKDGWKVLAELKNDPALCNIPVVIVTILDNQEMGYSLGASEYIAKPVDFERLTDVLAKLKNNPPKDYVLVVEDDASLREIERRTLEKAGWRVVEAANGNVAMQEIERAIPRLIVLDLMMPEMDGFQVIDRLRTSPEWQAIPIIVVTARDLSAEEREKLAGKVQEVLQKRGHRLEELAATVRETVARNSGATIS